MARSMRPIIAYSPRDVAALRTQPAGDVAMDGYAVRPPMLPCGGRLKVIGEVAAAPIRHKRWREACDLYRRRDPARRRRLIIQEDTVAEGVHHHHRGGASGRISAPPASTFARAMSCLSGIRLTDRDLSLAAA